MNASSIQWRLQAWYALLLATMLAALGVAAYELERDKLFGQINLELEDRCKLLAAAGSPLPPPQNPGDEEIPTATGRPPPLVFHLAPRDEALFGDQTPRQYYFQVVRRTGREFARSANFGTVREPQQEVKLVTPNELHILAGCSIAMDLAALHLVALKLTVVGGVILALGVAIGGGLVSRALRPIADISAAAAGAMGQASKLFQTAIQAIAPMAGYGSASKKSAFRMFDQLQNATFLNEPDLKKRRKMQADLVNKWKSQFVEGGDNAGIAADLQAQGATYYSAQQDALLQNRIQRQRKAEELASQREKLEGMNADPPPLDSLLGGVAKRNDQIEDIKAQQAELSGEMVQGIQDELSLSDDLLSTDQQVTAELAKQKGVLEGVAAVFGGLQTNNAFEQWSVDLTAANAKLMALGKIKDDLMARDAANQGEQAMLASKGDAYKQQQDAVAKEADQWQRLVDAVAKGPLRGDPDLSGGIRPAFYIHAAARMGMKIPAADLNDATIHKNLAAKKTAFDELEKKQQAIKEGMDPDNAGQVTQTARLHKLIEQNAADTLTAGNEAARIAAQRPGAIQQTMMQAGRAQTQRGLAANDFGASAPAKLANQRAYLTKDIAETEAEITRTEQAGGDALELKGRLVQDIYERNKNTLDVLHEQAGVEAQIKQLKIDQNREFMRSFMGAGPAEMLQKLAAFRMAYNNDGSQRPGLSQGAFFGMSPGMRENYSQLNPQYSPAMIELLRARGVAGQTVQGFAEGGYTGDGPAGQVAGVVHKGEYVVPAKDVDGNGMPLTTDAWKAYEQAAVVRPVIHPPGWDPRLKRPPGWDPRPKRPPGYDATAHRAPGSPGHDWFDTGDYTRRHTAEVAPARAWSAEQVAGVVRPVIHPPGWDPRPKRPPGYDATARRPPGWPGHDWFDTGDYTRRRTAEVARRHTAEVARARARSVQAKISGMIAATDARDRAWANQVTVLRPGTADASRARAWSDEQQQAQAKTSAAVASGYGYDPKKPGGRNIDAVILAGSEQFQKALAGLPAMLQTGLTASAKQFEDAGARFAAALDKLSKKIDGMAGGGGSKAAMPVNAQSGGNGGGAGFSRGSAAGEIG